MSPSPAPPPIDRLRLARLSALYGAEAFAQLRGLFLAESRERLTELEGAMQAGEAERLRRIAHRMVGLLGAIGAAGPAELARAVAEAETPESVMPLARELAGVAQRTSEIVLMLGDVASLIV